MHTVNSTVCIPLLVFCACYNLDNMQNAIILHGKANQIKYYDPMYASPSNAAWIPWIQKQLLMKDVLAQTPEMPRPWSPNYFDWSEEFERYHISSNTILIGHSCGAGFIIRWLSEHTNIRVGKVVLVAPWLDPDQNGDMGDFFDFTIDPNIIKRASEIIIFNSDNDFPSAQDSANIIREAVHGIKYLEINKRGHFTEITKFPELRDALLSIDEKV